MADSSLVLPRLTIERILAWAEAHHRRTGKWPTQSTPLHGVRGTKWSAVDVALARGYHGLPGGTTLRQLLIQHGRIKQVSPSMKRMTAAFVSRPPRTTADPKRPAPSAKLPRNCGNRFAAMPAKIHVGGKKTSSAANHADEKGETPQGGDQEKQLCESSS